MAFFVLALGVVTIANLQISGAVLYVTSSLPEESLLRIMTRYLRGSDEGAVEVLPPGEILSRLGKKRRVLWAVSATLAACGVATTAICLFLSRGAVRFVAPLFAVAALNGLMTAGLLSLWMRQVRRMRGRPD